jgi:hypothetical protein
MWVWIKPELFPICNPWFPEPVNVVVTLWRAITIYETVAGVTRCCRLCEAAQLPLRTRLSRRG